MKSETGKLQTGEFNPLHPPKGSTVVSKFCNHKWIPLDSDKLFDYDEDTGQRKYYQLYRFYCEHCLDVKDIKKYT